MKRRYITPAISYESIEDDELMINGTTYLQDKTLPGSDITVNNPEIGGEISDIGGNNSGGIYEDDGEGDD